MTQGSTYLNLKAAPFLMAFPFSFQVEVRDSLVVAVTSVPHPCAELTGPGTISSGLPDAFQSELDFDDVTHMVSPSSSLFIILSVRKQV